MLKKLGVWIASNLVKFVLSALASLLAAIGFALWSQQSPVFNPANLIPTEEIILFPDITDTPLVESQITPATNTPVPPTWEPPTPTAVPTIPRAACIVNAGVPGLHVGIKEDYSEEDYWLKRPSANTAIVGRYDSYGKEEYEETIDLLALKDGEWTFVHEFWDSGEGFVICSGGNGVYWSVAKRGVYPELD